MTRWSEQQLTDYLARSGVPGKPSQADSSAPPFAAPSDIILDLPAPPSVNKTRKIDWAASRAVKAWHNVANAYVLAAMGRTVGPLHLNKVPRFHLLIVVSEHHTKIDLDNGLKALIDYLRRIGLIEDDSWKHMRRLTVEWGYAPHGCRVTVRPCE
jgi:Holliday junction resolvase RusA-like endonuclease